MNEKHRVSDSTRVSLLCRLGENPEDQSVWEQFVERYGPQIFGWCKGWNLQHEDADEVTQMVLVRLATKMRTFRYDPGKSFRGWLRTLTRHAWSDFAVFKFKSSDAVSMQAIGMLQTIEARDDLEKRLAEAFDLELLESATSIVQEKVQPHTWEAFRLTAIERMTGAEASKQLDMTVASVFKAKSNVQQMLRQVLQSLDRSD